MKKISLLSLVFIALFLFSLADLSGSGVPTTNQALSLNNQSQVSNTSGAYVGTGSPLAVSFIGTFTNSSSWSETTTTLSSDFSAGTSFSVTNASTVTWTAYILVSPPSEIESLSFSVDYESTDWTPLAVTNPVGAVQTYAVDWFYIGGSVTVESSAIDTYGLWKIEFSSINTISDLELGINGGTLSSSAIFDVTDQMLFQTTSTWITGSTTKFTLTDPSGANWYSATNTTVGSSSHLLQSFTYRKDFTIDRSRHLGQNLNNYPVLINIFDTDLKTKVQSDGDDIVFVSGGKVLSHEIELFDQNYSPTQAHLIAWVKANLTGSVNTIISMYYGNPIIGAQENPDDVWTQSFAAVWHLDESTIDESSSGIHDDATSGDYDGSQRGNVITTGIVGYGQDFDGTDDWIEVQSTENLRPSGDVTISGWFRLDAVHNSLSPTTKLIFEKYLNGDNDMHIALVGTDYTSSAPAGSLVFKTENDASGQKYKYTSQTTWQANTWYYFACTIDSDTPNNNKIYVRAVDDTFGSYGSLTYAHVSYDSHWGIGGSWIDQVSGGRAYFDGRIDEVRVSNGIRSGAWIAAEFQNINNPTLFYSVGAETTRTSPDSFVTKLVDSSAAAGLWTVTAYYNDSGSSVDYMTGMLQRQFIVKHDSSIDIISPLDAVGGGIADATVNDVLYIKVELKDDISLSGITGSEVTINWTISGTPTNLQLNDLGAGEYGIAVNTTDLIDSKRWRIEIYSEHPFYNDASSFFLLDLFHPTDLTYAYIETTPIGFDFTATLFFYDTYSNTPISGATITFGDDSPVSVSAQGAGWYNISIPTGALSKGIHTYTLKASKPGSYLEIDTVDISFLLRPHYTSVSSTSDYVVPYGENTQITVNLFDLDTGTIPNIANVNQFIFTYEGGSQVRSSLASYAISLTTTTWSVGIHEVNLTVAMANSDYYPPMQHTFYITIRAHYTSVNIVGDLTSPFGNSTSLTIILTDLDTGGLVSISEVSGFLFQWSGGSQPASGSFDVLLDTSNWPVGPRVVTIITTMSGTNFQAPSNYQFTITIHSMAIRAYNSPSDLLFPNGDDFTLNISVEVTENGPYYGDMIDGLASDMAVVGYPSATISPLGNGLYNILIGSLFFSEGVYTITIQIDPTSTLYQSALLVVTFEYIPARSDLTANLYTVSTPFNHNITLTLFYEDRDRSVGITTAVITASTGWIDYSHISNGNYDVEIGVVGLSIGSHQITLTANADGYEEKSVIIMVIITRIHTDADPSEISLDIPLGNSKIIYIDYMDLDNSIPIPDTIPSVSGWLGSSPVSVIWDGSRYVVTFTTTGSDPLGLSVITFTFTNNPNYFQVSCDVEVNIRSHVTIFNLVSAPDPTPYNGIVNISVRYYDWDNKAGIDSINIQQYVWNGTDWITSSLVNDGSGYYTIQINASLFPKGIQNFIVYFNWTGPVQQYENKQTTASVNIIGIDSQLTVLQASEPTAYGNSMSYIFFFSETSGLGITNSSYGGGNVHIFVEFQGVTGVDLGLVTILEINDITQPGNYSISFSNTIFGKTGLIYMNVYINWTEGVAPFYTNRFDVISVRVLPRDTLVSIVPPTPTPYGENATLIFSYEDVTGGGSTPIDDDPKLSLILSLADYSVYYNLTLQEFVVSFDTSQFSAPLGQKSFTLSVIWSGAPYYANRTGRVIYITVTARQTVLDFQAPAPTSFGNSVWFILTWTDVTGVPSSGISGATVTLYSNLVEIPGAFYSVSPISAGEY
ncbi:MAG: LamG-like jellyroll fold domain-containing protein, partial [Candidatus Sifarchaeia archaeon]